MIEWTEETKSKKYFPVLKTFLSSKYFATSFGISGVPGADQSKLDKTMSLVIFETLSS